MAEGYSEESKNSYVLGCFILPEFQGKRKGKEKRKKQESSSLV